MDYYGTYNHKLDSKSRVALPSKFRRLLESGQEANKTVSLDLLAMLSPDNDNISVYTIDDFELYIKMVFDVVGGYNPRNKQHVELRMALHACVVDISIDKAGRITLPHTFIEKVGIKNDVTIVGNEGHFEIWDKYKFNNKINNIDLSKLLYTETS